MLRRSLAACALFFAACQDYNFNPVGKCVIQPGASRIQLSSLATADVLFVVDDSFSMNPKQQLLADNFRSFIDALAATQAQRAQNGLVPLEFHIAITTSSVFEGQFNSNIFSKCTAAPAPGTGLQCSVDRPAFGWSAAYKYACSPTGVDCPDLVQSYIFGEFTDNTGKVVCLPGVAGTDGDHKPYPRGDFVAANGNARVLHFTKDLAWNTWTTANPDPKITDLVRQFSENIKVGTCGSSMEQHFEAAKLAIQKAVAGQQPGVAAGEWPHPGAKLVVVWVGDEDDCSNPNDPMKALVFGDNSPGKDVCALDTAKPVASQKLFLVKPDVSRPSEPDYVDFFAGLGRQFGAAFIYSTDGNACTDDPAHPGSTLCAPGFCNVGPSPCPSGTGCTGGLAPGNRFNQLSGAMKEKGITSVEASVCDASFGTTLGRIAELVKPPPGLTLPTQPASSEVALLRIETVDGKSSRQCTGPATKSDELPTTDWWFVDCRSGDPVLDATTSCININHATKHCEANPGETYVAQYLGIVPPPSAKSPQGGCLTADDCQAALGGTAKDWSCAAPAAAARGTCVCTGG